MIGARGGQAGDNSRKKNRVFYGLSCEQSLLGSWKWNDDTKNGFYATGHATHSTRKRQFS